MHFSMFLLQNVPPSLPLMAPLTCRWLSHCQVPFMVLSFCLHMYPSGGKNWSGTTSCPVECSAREGTNPNRCLPWQEVPSREWVKQLCFRLMGQVLYSNSLSHSHVTRSLASHCGAAELVSLPPVSILPHTVSFPPSFPPSLPPSLRPSLPPSALSTRIMAATRTGMKLSSRDWYVGVEDTELLMLGVGSGYHGWEKNCSSVGLEPPGKKNQCWAVWQLKMISRFRATLHVCLSHSRAIEGTAPLKCLWKHPLPQAGCKIIGGRDLSAEIWLHSRGLLSKPCCCMPWASLGTRRAVMGVPRSPA